MNTINNYQDLVLYYINKFTNKNLNSLYNYSKKIEPVKKQNKIISGISKKLYSIGIANVIDLVTYDNMILVITRDHNVTVYKMSKNKIKIYKKLLFSPLSFYYSQLKSDLRKYSLILYLRLLKCFKHEAFFEAFINYINLNQIKKCKESDGKLYIQYYSGEIIQIFETEDLIFGKKSVDSDFKFSNLKENKYEGITITNNSVIVSSFNNNLIDKVTIKNIKKYFISDNKIFLITNDKIIYLNYE